jgi:hypothetical protein
MHLGLTSLHPVLCRCDSIKKKLNKKNIDYKKLSNIIIKSDLIC